MGEWRANLDSDIFGRRSVYLVQKWQIQQPNMAHWSVVCKKCASPLLVRYGTDRKGNRRFRCKVCDYTFTDNNAPPGMRFPTQAIASAINQFYESASLHKIQRQLRLDYGHCPDHSNIYRWVMKYTRTAAQAFKDVPILTGDTWIADETVLKLKTDGGKNVWLFDIIDDDSRFLLATHLTMTRTTRDAATLMERALKRSDGVAPITIITDKLRSYLDGIERVFGASAQHVQSGPFKTTDSSRAIERFHGTLKDRTKIMRALANRETANAILDGWLVHYNFFRPHAGLKGKTPAYAAGAIDIPFESWADVVNYG